MIELQADMNITEGLSAQLDDNLRLNAQLNDVLVAGVTSWNGQIGDVTFDGYTKVQTNSLLNEKADTADLSEVATSGNYNDLNNKPTILEPLIGYSTNITPTQVLGAIQDGRAICLNYFSDVFGLLKFTYFVYSQGMNLVFATAVIFTASPYGLYNATINGYVSDNTWQLSLIPLTTAEDIPTNVSQLTNDAGYATQTWVQQQDYATETYVDNIVGDIESLLAAI